MRDERNSGRASCEVKIRLDSKPTFKKQGHEKQFLFNELVWEQFDVIDSALKQTLPTVEKACAAIQKGECLIDIRQKNIKIADRSEHGWATVAEYEEDELADNSDDEKRLFRAEARAGRKKQRSLKDSNKKKGASRKHFLECRGRILCHMAVSPLRLLVVPSLARAFSGCCMAQLQVPKPSVAPSGANSQLGPCFLCGKLGHYRKSCPLLQASTVHMYLS